MAYKYKRSSTHVELEQYVYRLGTYHYNWHRAGIPSPW